MRSARPRGAARPRSRRLFPPKSEHDALDMLSSEEKEDDWGQRGKVTSSSDRDGKSPSPPCILSSRYQQAASALQTRRTRRRPSPPTSGCWRTVGPPFLSSYEVRPDLPSWVKGRSCHTRDPARRGRAPARPGKPCRGEPSAPDASFSDPSGATRRPSSGAEAETPRGLTEGLLGPRIHQEGCRAKFLTAQAES